MDFLRRFMRGRNGIDELSQLMIIGALVVRLIFFDWLKIEFIAMISFITSIFGLYRIFSKNKNKRYRENMKYLDLKRSIRSFINKKLRRLKGLKDYRYFSCPSCNQELRVPRGKGKLSIRCPKCGHKIIRRT